MPTRRSSSARAARALSNEGAEGDPHTRLVDLLTDLRHWARANRVDWERALSSALDTHYPAEARHGLDEEYRA